MFIASLYAPSRSRRPLSVLKGLVLKGLPCHILYHMFIIPFVSCSNRFSVRWQSVIPPDFLHCHQSTKQPLHNFELCRLHRTLLWLCFTCTVVWLDQSSYMHQRVTSLPCYPTLVEVVQNVIHERTRWAITVQASSPKRKLRLQNFSEPLSSLTALLNHH